eukprot:gene2989-3722_t
MVANYDRIRDKIEAVLPAFANYNERIRQPGGFRLPLPPTERVWKTPSGKAEFLVFPGLNEDPRISDPQVLTLTTLRSHDQYNTTIYGFDDRYRGVFGRRDVLFMNAADIAERGLVAGESVEVHAAPEEGEQSDLSAVMKPVTLVAYDIPKGCVG